MDASQFRRVWGLLKKKGWKHRAGSGLDSSILYIRPGCTAKGRRGVDVFAGDTALIGYLFVNPREVDREFALWVAAEDARRSTASTDNTAQAPAAPASVPAPAPSPSPPASVSAASQVGSSPSPAAATAPSPASLLPSPPPAAPLSANPPASVSAVSQDGSSASAAAATAPSPTTSLPSPPLAAPTTTPNAPASSGGRAAGKRKAANPGPASERSKTNPSSQVQPKKKTKVPPAVVPATSTPPSTSASDPPAKRSKPKSHSEAQPQRKKRKTTATAMAVSEVSTSSTPTTAVGSTTTAVAAGASLSGGANSDPVPNISTPPQPSPQTDQPATLPNDDELAADVEPVQRPRRAASKQRATTVDSDAADDDGDSDFEGDADNDEDADDNSDEDVDDVSAPASTPSTPPRRAQPRAARAPRQSQPLSDDVNTVLAGDDANEYHALGSDGGAGYDESGDSDSDDSREAEEELEAVDTAAADAALYQEFLDLVGEENAAMGTIKADILKAMSTNGWANAVRPDIAHYMDGPYTPVDTLRADYPGLYNGYYGPSTDILRHADSPLKLFFYFLPSTLWQEIALETNDYFTEHLDERVEAAFAYQTRRKQKNPNYKVKTRQEIKLSLRASRPVLPHEIVNFVGLLIARSIAPNREKLANHWKTVEEVGIPRGCFGKIMARDRFMHVSSNLHFSSNTDPRARTDRAWKIRPVLEVLEQTFRRGYVLPPVLSFDEAMLPSRSSFNRLRVYMKDKPHKWGTKLFMTCCANTAYCIRAEVYGGKAQTGDKVDVKAGPAAVMRNINHVFGTRANPDDKRLIVTDRFYTSVALAIQLLAIGFYTVGTIITNRLGYAKAIVDPRKKRPADVDRGTCAIAKSLHVPKMSALCWWDNKPVHFLATGGSMDLDRVARREKSGERVEVPTPKVIKDYQRFMGGVDVHDQLRLQRYSVQRAVRFQKYYKSLFLGLIDLAIVNAFIVYRLYHKRQSKTASHVKFMKQLHAQLCQVQVEDMERLSEAEEDPVVVRSRTEHVPEKTDEWRSGNGPNDRKRRQRACKVCSLLKEDGVRRGYDTRMVCSTCRIKDQRVYLCDVPRRDYNGVRMSCFDIWHKKWLCGKAIRGTDKKIRARPTPANESTNA